MQSNFYLFTSLETDMFNKHIYMFNSYLNLGPPLPELVGDDLLDEEKRQELIIALDQRIKKKDELREVLISQSIK